MIHQIVVITTPFRGLRLLIGGLFALTFGLLVFGIARGSAACFWSVPSAVFLGAGALLWFGLEHSALIETEPKRLTASWRFFGRPIGPVRTCHLSRATRVKIHKKKLDDIYIQPKIFVQDFAFPVYVMESDAVLTHVIGWPEKKAEKRFEIDLTALANGAHFPDYAQWAAAVSAVALGLELEDERSATVYSPAEVPAQWLDESRIRMTISMRSAWK